MAKGKPPPFMRKGAAAAPKGPPRRPPPMAGPPMAGPPAGAPPPQGMPFKRGGKVGRK